MNRNYDTTMHLIYIVEDHKDANIFMMPNDLWVYSNRDTEVAEGNNCNRIWFPRRF